MSISFDCPKCKHIATRVVDSRAGANFHGVSRRRACQDCGHRFNTVERIDDGQFQRAFRQNERVQAIVKQLNKALTCDPYRPYRGRNREPSHDR